MTTAGGALPPTMIRIGSPGTRWIRMNEKSVMPTMTGTLCSTRFVK